MNWVDRLGKENKRYTFTDKPTNMYQRNPDEMKRITKIIDDKLFGIRQKKD